MSDVFDCMRQVKVEVDGQTKKTAEAHGSSREVWLSRACVIPDMHSPDHMPANDEGARAAAAESVNNTAAALLRLRLRALLLATQ